MSHMKFQEWALKKKNPMNLITQKVRVSSREWAVVKKTKVLTNNHFSLGLIPNCKSCSSLQVILY